MSLKPKIKPSVKPPLQRLPPVPPSETLAKLAEKPFNPPFERTVSREQLNKQKLESIHQMEARDQAQKMELISKLKRELEEEIEKWRRRREEQLFNRRREEERQIQAEPLTAETAVVQGKRRRGWFGFWGRRIKSVQQQFQPETVGRRIGG